MADGDDLTIKTSQGNLFYGTFSARCQTSEDQGIGTFRPDVLKNDIGKIRRKM